MTSKEAGEEIKYLRAQHARLGQEIEGIIRQFCGRDRPHQERHYFLKLWQRIDDGELYKAVGYVCVLCRVQKPLEQKGHRCPICNELWDESYTSSEDAAQCLCCGFNNMSNPTGLLLSKIPHGDEIYSKFTEF